jgi:lipid-A-disaccharide synthase-like uncharacterized protein
MNFLDYWVILGLVGQFLFFMRFVVQWISTERKGRVVVPVYFWYFSLAGGFILFIYAVHEHDLVFTLGQGLGLFIYARNLVVEYRNPSKEM